MNSSPVLKFYGHIEIHVALLSLPHLYIPIPTPPPQKKSQDFFSLTKCLFYDLNSLMI